MELATFLILLGALAVGISGSVASTWGLRREVYRLKLDVVDIQNRILTENKRKAAEARWQKPDKLAVEAEALAAAAGGQQSKNPWDLF
ncbi:MAG TPA: hypothetical protein PLT20_12410 [Sedimentisphaerales bacterium]|nr:hypothetical protein [Sedimentisphaerales bacterium]HQK89032.1 hypothetical protein [Acidobacteriota bacterium]